MENNTAPVISNQETLDESNIHIAINNVNYVNVNVVVKYNLLLIFQYLE